MEAGAPAASEAADGSLVTHSFVAASGIGFVGVIEDLQDDGPIPLDAGDLLAAAICELVLGNGEHQVVSSGALVCLQTQDGLVPVYSVPGSGVGATGVPEHPNLLVRVPGRSGPDL